MHTYIYAGLRGRTNRSCLTRKQTAADASFSLSSPCASASSLFFSSSRHRKNTTLLLFLSSPGSGRFLARPLVVVPAAAAAATAAAAPLQKNSRPVLGSQCSAAGQRPANRRRTQPGGHEGQEKEASAGIECPPLAKIHPSRISNPATCNCPACDELAPLCWFPTLLLPPQSSTVAYLLFGIECRRWTIGERAPWAVVLSACLLACMYLPACPVAGPSGARQTWPIPVKSCPITIVTIILIHARPSLATTSPRVRPGAMQSASNPDPAFAPLGDVWLRGNETTMPLRQARSQPSTPVLSRATARITITNGTVTLQQLRRRRRRRRRVWMLGHDEKSFACRLGCYSQLFLLPFFPCLTQDGALHVPRLPSSVKECQGASANWLLAEMVVVCSRAFATKRSTEASHGCPIARPWFHPASPPRSSRRADGLP
ncbi:hypothetical protein IWX92DRAFT_389076 [Phyllosticta citricarpa]